MRIWQRRIRELIRERKISVAALARRCGRRREDVQRSLSSAHVWRLDRLLDYARALDAAPDDLLRPLTAANEFTILARHARWDDRLSSRRERATRLAGADRFREVARIIEGVPMEDWWRDLDLAALHRHYPLIRPHLGRTRRMWDAILPLLATPAA